MSLSPNVTKVAQKSKDAHDVIKKMQTDMESDLQAAEKIFKNRIKSSLSEAMITDDRLLQEDQAMKVEFRSEFSLDKIAEVVNKSLLAVIEATDPMTPNPAISPDALESYTAVVSAVAEAARSSSTVSSSLSYNMTHISPGIYAFLYATANSIHDEKLLGTEAVTATAIFYRIVESIQDVQHAAAFDSVAMALKTKRTWEAIRLDNIKQFGDRTISRTEWAAMDATAAAQIAAAQADIDKASRTGGPMLETLGTPEKSDAGLTEADAVFNQLKSESSNILEMLQTQGEDTADARAIFESLAAGGS